MRTKNPSSGSAERNGNGRMAHVFGMCGVDVSD